MFLKGYPLEAKSAPKNWNVSLYIFWARLASFGHLDKVRKRAKIRNRYNQAPHLTQNTNGKVTTSQWHITNESQEVRIFPAGDHTASTIRHAWKHYKTRRNNINDPKKKHHLGTVCKNILLEGLNQLNGEPNSPSVQMWIKIDVCFSRKTPN